MLGPLKAAMVEYRRNLPGLLPPDDALLESMPEVSPKPGTTPQAVAASAVWVPALQKARITIIPNVNPAVPVSGYQVRSCPGPGTYKTTEESVVGNFAQGATTFNTDAGLTQPGATALYKVYSLTVTGNEKGGTAMKLTRPAS